MVCGLLYGMSSVVYVGNLVVCVPLSGTLAVEWY